MIRFDAYRDGFLNARLTRSFTNAAYHASGKESTRSTDHSGKTALKRAVMRR